MNSIEPSILILIGVSNSGKSAFAKVYKGIAQTVSRDKLRSAITNDYLLEADIDRIAIEGLLANIGAGRSVFYDAPNLTAAVRRPVIEAANHFGIPVRAIQLLIDPEEAVERGEVGGRGLPPQAILTQLALMEEPTYDEGFDQIDLIYRNPDTLSLEFTPKAS